MLKKLAEAIAELSYSIPENEKSVAQNIVENLNQLKGSVSQASDLLNKTQPFEKYQTISSKALYDKRGAIGRYHKEVKEHFEKCKKEAFFILEKMKNFESDHNIAELISSLREGMEETEKKAEDVLAALDDLQAPDFRDKVLNGVKKTQEQCEKVKDLIEERIQDHFVKNFLPNQWSESVSKLVEHVITPQLPLMSRLFEEREKVLHQNSIPQIPKRPQALSPALTQSMMYATDQRSSSGVE
jgi:hypothetical protein